MEWKCWNIRDETEENLKTELEKTYKNIDNAYKLLKKVAAANDAKMLIDEIWKDKAKASDIEIELMRRAYTWHIGAE